jgi:hypothetical protein
MTSDPASRMATRGIATSDLRLDGVARAHHNRKAVGALAGIAGSGDTVGDCGSADRGGQRCGRRACSLVRVGAAVHTGMVRGDGLWMHREVRQGRGRFVFSRV